MDNINIKKEVKKIKKELETSIKYQRKSCKNCEYKIFCAGECDKTI